MSRKKSFYSLCNQEIVDLEPVTGADVELVKGLVREHQQLTGSTVAERLLAEWDSSVNMFVKVRLDKGQFVVIYAIYCFFCDDHSFFLTLEEIHTPFHLHKTLVPLNQYNTTLKLEG